MLVSTKLETCAQNENDSSNFYCDRSVVCDWKNQGYQTVLLSFEDNKGKTIIIPMCAGFKKISIYHE